MYYRSVFAAFSADRPDLKKVYDTANFHHFVHTLALLAVPLCRRPALVSPRIFFIKARSQEKFHAYHSQKSEIHAAKFQKFKVLKKIDSTFS